MTAPWSTIGRWPVCHRVLPCCVSRARRVRQPAEGALLATALLNDLARIAAPCIVVLDDHHTLAAGEKRPAVITDYYGGPHQGTAIAEAIFGVTNRGGKLTSTIPRHVGQTPIHHAQPWGSGYQRTATDIHKGYVDMPSTPLFALGYGLSYTSFDYSPLKLETDSVDIGGRTLRVTYREECG